MSQISNTIDKFNSVFEKWNKVKTKISGLKHRQEDENIGKSQRDMKTQ